MSFACSRCYSRHPFEELSTGQQLCKDCRSTYLTVKCTYCRTEFQQPSKSSTTSVCKKCELNVKSYGKPQSCGYCNIIAAFIGSKCQRCTNSEKKYGLPVTCEQCKMQCAFDRKDEDKKVDGKLLCWLCTLSYKRALAKTKQTDPTRHTHCKLGKKKPYDKRPQRVDVTKLTDSPQKAPTTSSTNNSAPTTNKETSKMDLDHNCSDHVVALTQLREQIAALNRQVQQRDQQLLQKDRQITDLKATNFTTENELRSKLKDAQKEHESKVHQMNLKLKQMQKDLATKSKTSTNKKSSLTIVGRKLSPSNDNSDNNSD